MQNRRMFGIFAPEVQLLAETMEIIELFQNVYLVTEGDAGNSWIAQMTSLRRLFFGTTAFEYPGIPTFINALTQLGTLQYSNPCLVLSSLPYLGLRNC